jgi:hypothetical protein
MKRLPSIGSRVIYTSDNFWAKGHTLSGTVVAHYPKHADKFDIETGDFISGGELLSESQWGVSVELDQIPPNYPYNTRRVVARLDNLKPL